MSSILFTIGLVKTVTKTNETISGEVIFRLNEIEFDCLEFKIFNRSSESLFRDVVKGCMYSFVGSFFFDIKIKLVVYQAIKLDIPINDIKEPEESLPLSMPYLTFSGEVLGDHEVINIDDDNDYINTFKVSRQMYNAFCKEGQDKRKQLEISVVYNKTKRFNSVEDHVMNKNVPFHVSGGLCIGEKLLLNADTIEWTFLNPSSPSDTKKISKTTKITTATTRLKNIESRLFHNSSPSITSSQAPSTLTSSSTSSTSSSLPSSSSSSSSTQQQQQEVINIPERDEFYQEDLLDIAITNVKSKGKGKKVSVGNVNKSKHETRSKKPRTENQ